jgi:hypothetical protein
MVAVVVVASVAVAAVADSTVAAVADTTATTAMVVVDSKAVTNPPQQTQTLECPALGSDILFLTRPDRHIQ